MGHRASGDELVHLSNLGWPCGGRVGLQLFVASVHDELIAMEM